MRFSYNIDNATGEIILGAHGSCPTALPGQTQVCSDVEYSARRHIYDFNLARFLEKTEEQLQQQTAADTSAVTAVATTRASKIAELKANIEGISQTNTNEALRLLAELVGIDLS